MMPSYERSNLNLNLRVRVALALVVLAFCVLILRLWYLQIVQGDSFREKSENNRLRSVYIPPPRGLIRDRDGVVLARNRPAFNIELISEDAPDPKATILHLAEIVKQDPKELLTQLHLQRSRRPFEPKLILKDVSRDVVAQVAARRYELPGLVITVNPARFYVYGSVASHVLGYIREINRNQLDSPRYAGYRSGDLVGQYGVESKFESYLQGQRGVQMVIVNATGSRIAEASYDPERAGHNLTLTLDIDVQRAADMALQGKKGAVVALDPNTGEVLALSSAPNFDPNLFAGEIKPEDWQDLVMGPGHKLNNRAVQGTFAPGSVFKIFMDAASLAEGVVGFKEQINCPGVFVLGGHPFRCHKHTGHGLVDHYMGLVESCDVYFYTMGQRLGIDRIYDYATRFGLGSPTGIELSDEAAGLIPSTEWKRQYYKSRGPEYQRWYPGETPSVAIGQGQVTVTPIQIARGLAAVLNGGKVLKPWLVKKIESNDGSFKEEGFKPEVQKKVEIDPQILKIVRTDMVGVVNDEHGTGRRARLSADLDVTVGGKTGTAQLAGGERNARFGDNAWFAGYAPAEKPEIVVVAVVEQGGHGGTAAAPIVRQVMESYFYKHLKPSPTEVASVDR